MRVLHLPTSVGGNSFGLASGERALGLRSDVLVRSRNWYDHPARINLDLQNCSSKLTQLRSLLAAFVKIRKKYDVFHFNFGSSLLHSLADNIVLFDLPFYPKGAKLFATYNGCDARQKYPTMARAGISACQNPDCYNGMCNSGRLDSRRTRSIAKMARYVKHMWALNPDLLYFLPPDKASFLPYSLLSESDRRFIPHFDKKLIVVHAPTDRAAKGSDFLFAAVDKLTRTHSAYFEFHTVEDMAHSQAVRMYQKADLVVDQLVIGWYGGLAVEVMKMGKPVIARICSDDLKFIPPKMAEDVVDTVINADPATIYDVLKSCIEDRSALKRHSEAGMDYVNKWHDPRYVASLTKKQYEAD